MNNDLDARQCGKVSLATHGHIFSFPMVRGPKLLLQVESA